MKELEITITGVIKKDGSIRVVTTGDSAEGVECREVVTNLEGVGREEERLTLACDWLNKCIARESKKILKSWRSNDEDD